jgi:UDP-glucuronate decarboxylase
LLFSGRGYLDISQLALNIELAEQVIKLTGSRSKLTFIPLPQDHPRQRQPDITLTHTSLGWESTVPLKEGLRKTIVNFDRLLSA